VVGDDAEVAASSTASSSAAVVVVAASDSTTSLVSVARSATGETSFTTFEVVVDTAVARVSLMGSGQTTTSAGASHAGGTAMTAASQSFLSLETELIEGGGELVIVLAWRAIVLFVSTVLTARQNTAGL